MNDHDETISPELTEGSCMAGVVSEEAIEATEEEAREHDDRLTDLYSGLEDGPTPDLEEAEGEAADEGDESVVQAMTEVADEAFAAARAALRYPGYFAHRFVRIHRSNWTAGRQGQKPQYVIIHIMEGSYAGSISWARNPVSNVSWHYACSRKGHTTQNLGEHNSAWTNSVWWWNIRSVSIEHGGFCRYGGPTTAQLHASAKLTAGICLRHGIPINRGRIRGHTEIPGVAKPCPCKWPWRRYMNLVRRYAGKAPGGEKPPGLVHRVIAGSFAQKSGADKRARELKAAGFGAWVYGHDGMQRVQVASFSDKSNAREVETRLKRKGFDAFIASEQLR